MFYLVNFGNSLFKSRSRRAHDNDRLLESEDYFVLDTDDLVVEQVSYDTLFDLVLHKNIKIKGVKRYGIDMFLSSHGWAMCDYGTPRLTYKGTVALRTAACLSVRGNLLEFRVGVHNDVACLYINNVQYVYWYVKNNNLDIVNILYFYKVGKYLIVRLVIEESMRSIWESVLTVIVDFSGNVIDVLDLSGVSLMRSKDPAFSSKFSMTLAHKY